MKHSETTQRSTESQPYAFFMRPESNRVHPSTITPYYIIANLPAGLEPWDAVLAARSAGHSIPLGSSRTGVEEIQNDDGTWFRKGTNRRDKSTWTFESSDEFDASF